MIVPDASAIIEVLLRTPRGDAVAARLFAARESLHAPHLLDVEVTQVLRRYVAKGELTSQRADDSLSLLAAFPMLRYAHTPLLQRMWALRDNLTAYDAAYVALAEGLRAVLITCDARLAAASGTAVRISLM